MKNSKGLKASLLAAILALLSGPRLAAANGDNDIVVNKAQQFVLTSTAGPVAFPGAPFSFHSDSPVAMSITPPGGSSIALTKSGDSTNYQYSKDFATKAALDAAYPDGSYTFSVSGVPDFTLSLTGSVYPNTPALLGGTYLSSTLLFLDPSHDNTLNLNKFTGYGNSSAGSHMQFQLQSPDGTTVNISQSAITPTNPLPFTTYVIPANTLAPSCFALSVLVSALSTATYTSQFGGTFIATWSAISV